MPSQCGNTLREGRVPTQGFQSAHAYKRRESRLAHRRREPPAVSRISQWDICCAAYVAQATTAKLETCTCRIRLRARQAPASRNFVVTARPLETQRIGGVSSIRNHQAVGIRDEKLATQSQSGRGRSPGITSRILLRGRLTPLHTHRRFKRNRGKRGRGHRHAESPLGVSLSVHLEGVGIRYHATGTYSEGPRAY